MRVRILRVNPAFKNERYVDTVTLRIFDSKDAVIDSFDLSVFALNNFFPVDENTVKTYVGQDLDMTLKAL